MPTPAYCKKLIEVTLPQHRCCVVNGAYTDEMDGTWRHI